MTDPDTIARLQDLIQTKKTFSFEDYFEKGVETGTST